MDCKVRASYVGWMEDAQLSFHTFVSILTLRFINCVKFNFGKSYLPSDSHKNNVISDRFAYPSFLHFPRVLKCPSCFIVIHGLGFIC